MAALDLQDDPYKYLRGSAPAAEGGIGALDLGRSVAAGVYDVGAGLAGAGQYVTGGGEDSYLAQARRFSEAGAESWEQSMSPAARRAATATVLPQQGKASMWDEDVSTSGAVALKVSRSIPSLVASLVPGGIASRVALGLGAARAGAAAAGTAVGGGVGAAQNAGDVFNDIQNAILKEPDAKLQEQSEIYRGMRMSGMSEEDAKDRVIDSAAGYKPIIAGAITALTSRYGVEGLVARRAAGETSRGVLRQAGMGVAGESTQEFLEEGSGALLKQAGAADARGKGYKFDWMEALNAGLEGALVGGVTGGLVGAAAGAGRRTVVRDRPIDEDHEAALVDQPQLAAQPVPKPRVVTPEVTPTGPEVTLDQKGTIAGHEMDGLDKTIKDAGANAGVVEHVDTPAATPAAPAGIGVDEAAALAQYDPELGENPDAFIQDDLEPREIPPPLPVVPDVPVVTPQVAEAIGSAPVSAAVQPTEPLLPAGSGEPSLQAPAQLAPERAAAPALEPTIPPTTGRVLENLKQRPRMGKLKKAQIEAGVAPEAVLSAKELRTKARQDELGGLAERVRAAQAELTVPAATAPPKELRAYARQLAEKAQIGDVKLANLSADIDPAVRLVKAAEQIGKGAGTRSAVMDFLANDTDLRKGGTAIKEYAQAQTPSGISFTEGVGEDEGTKGGAVRNAPEEEIVEEIDAKRAAVRRAELEREEAAATAKAATEKEAKVAAAMQDLVAGEAKRPVVVETRKRRVVTPQQRGALTRRGNRAAVGEATATTPAEAVAQLQTQRVEENRDVLPRRPEDEAAARELDRVMERSERKGTLGEILSKKDILFNDYAGGHRVLMQEVAGRIRKLAGDVPVRIVDDRTFTEEWASRKTVDDEGPLPDGFYDPDADEILARTDRLSTPLIIHEGLHAAYLHALDERRDVREHVRTLMSAVARQLIKEASQNGQATIKLPYGMTNEHEFISEAFSNHTFQELLMRTPADRAAGAQARGFKRALYSIWDAMIRHVKQAVFKEGGPSIGILEQVIRATQQLDTTATRQRTGGPLMPSRQGGQTINVQEALASMGQNVADRGPGAEKWWRRTGLKLSTFDQFTRSNESLFDRARGEGNPLRRIYNALSEQGVFVDKKRKEGQVWAQRFKELEQTAGRNVMNRAASVMIDATMADVNLGPGADNSHLGKDAARYYQNKAQLARLETEFASLPQEVRSFILDSSAYYRTTQNEMTRALISNVLQAHAPTLSPQAYAQLTTNTMNGTLGDVDAGIIDNDAVFKALRDAAGLRVLKGIYFPLMRHGGHVVRTLERLGELHGGKVVETDKDGNVILEFTAPKDKAARAAYKKFADSTTAKITSVGKRRYLPDGTQVKAEDAVGRTHYVAYRIRVQRRGIHFFDTDKQAEKFIREQGSTYESISPTALDRADQEAKGDLTNAQFAAIMSSIDRRTDLKSDEKGRLIGALREASVRLMSGNRVQHRSIARRNVAGASDDIARNTVQYATAASNYLGKLRYMPKVNVALADMRELQDREKDHVDEAARGQVLNEVVKRIDKNVVNVRDPPQFVKDIMTLSFMDKLFSPMYSAIDGMQPWMVTLPVLSGHYGVLRSAAAIGRAYNSVGAGGLVWSGVKDTATAMRQIASIGLDTTDLVGSIRRKVAGEADGAALGRLIDELVNTGQISPEAGFELAGAVSAGRGPGGVALAKVERIARQMPLAIEAINRAATGVATYRLGRSAGMTEEQAIAHAKDMVDQTQGNYNTFNQPRIFNHPLASPALQFKKYAQLMSALMVDMVKKASFGTKREKQIALKQIGALLSVQMAMAGAMGLPGLELLKVGFMIASMFGLGDGWDDMGRKLRKTFEAALGKTPGELVTRGVISRGIAQFIPFPDISTRVSLADMWLWGEPKSTDRQGAQAYLLNLVGGAPVSLALDWMEALQHASRGEAQEFFIKIVPAKFVADTAKAVKLRGQRDITDAEFVIQSLGARSARMAEEGEHKGGDIALGKKMEEERKLLTRQYIAAGSQGELLKIRARIVAHNRQITESGKNQRQRVGTTGLDKIRANEEKRRAALQGE